MGGASTFGGASGESGGASEASEVGDELEGFTSLGAGLELFREQFAKENAAIDGKDSGAPPEKMVIGIPLQGDLLEHLSAVLESLQKSDVGGIP